MRTNSGVEVAAGGDLLFAFLFLARVLLAIESAVAAAVTAVVTGVSGSPGGAGRVASGVALVTGPARVALGGDVCGSGARRLWVAVGCVLRCGGIR